MESEGRGFWVSDSLLETWLLAVAREIDFMDEPPDWLLEARQHWYLQATIGCMGCISPNIDDFITSASRKQQVLRLSEQALASLLERNCDKDIKIESWSGYGLTDTTLNTFLADLQEVGQINLVKAAKQFIKLLSGEVTCGVSDVEAVAWMRE